MFSDIFSFDRYQIARISMSVSQKSWRKIVPASFNAEWAAVPCVTSIFLFYINFTEKKRIHKACDTQKEGSV